MIGKITPDEPACITEGFATGASIQEVTGYAVVVAFEAGNLRKIAQALRAKSPDAVIVLYADDDESGRRGASDAAQAVNGLLRYLCFPKGQPLLSSATSTIWQHYPVLKL